MSRYAAALATSLALVAASPGSAEIRLGDVTADGHWDCKDLAGAGKGAVVVADTSYAYVQPDGKLGGYGKLYLINENFDLPHFVIVSGLLKEKLGSFGFSMRGPRDNPHDLSRDLFLTVIFSPDNKGDWECVRRGGGGR